ncbi:exopolysaccharide biosynthesis polyprenyl glycosylphosphotransferase [Streptomyces finlayi]|uniref:Exopolysaccharide biosynthesis polyprenyl glycosylphosphotransferase n=1 Tax=Streptomyces finlayi TaxID=67296 RepID=A0A7G7BFU6_9ACTN|nr:exopolysaccharide biosynthesis polyprenyl glycosylphosphotransferase [Streptomyces finlayi]QNE74211.1 exopolysaccharide biosynthesis polyprenyl glycosylphosphotransferase [Streptomyces finlayi]
MTTERAPAPRTAQATAEPPAASTIHPPRRGNRHKPAGRTTRRFRGYGSTGRLLAADALALGLTLAVLPAAPWPPAVIAVQMAVQLLLHAYRGLYRPGLSVSGLAELPALLGLALIQWFATAEVLTAYDPRSSISWTALGLAIVTQTVLCCAARALAHRSRLRSAARNPRSALVIGHGPAAQEVAAALHGHPEYGLRPVGRVDPASSASSASDTPAAPAADAAPLPVLVTLEDVGRAVIQNSVRDAFFTTAPGATRDGEALFALLAGHGCRMWLINGPAAGAFTPHRASARPDHLWGFAAYSLHNGGGRPVAYAAKRTMDAVLAGLALLAAAPLLAACGLAVRISDGPGVIFRQERIGRNGRPFVLLKFRTIRPADAHESATRWNVSADRNMSRVGRLLRRTSLDELPQLWNVVRGDMSLVGPRPERPYFVEQFGRVHTGYGARHRMPVGITGLAQVHGLRGDTSIEDRARFDNRYIETWSLWQDVCLLVRTAGSLFRPGGS